MEAHQISEVDTSVAALKAVAEAVRAAMPFDVRCRIVDDGAALDSESKSMKVHFIRHGEGAHNVLQREWRAQPDWDGASEPYTLDTDPDFNYRDAELTAVGQGQAQALQSRSNAITPELLVVSTMRRATQTGLLAFDQHITAGRLPVVACELAHEIGGKHTCDKRLSKAELIKAFPCVNYDLVDSEEDPFWGDGRSRESFEDLASRAATFVMFLKDRPEKHVAVAAHSAWLLALFTAVFDCESEKDSSWFGTGEMRTVELVFVDK